MWIKTKTFFLKVWEFVKLYGKEVVFVALLIYVFFLVKNKTQLIEQLMQEREVTRRAHQENITRLTQQVEAEHSSRKDE